MDAPTRRGVRRTAPARFAFLLSLIVGGSAGPVAVDAIRVVAATQEAVDVHRREQETAPQHGSGVVEKNGQRLSTLDAWPRREHWQDGRSAKESARSWLRAAPALPAEIAATLSSHRDLGTLRDDWRAEPEARVRIDRFRGNVPNVDVLLVGSDRNGPVVVAVEAKADETFGRTVGGTLDDARSRLDRNPRSRGVARIERLVAALFGTTTADLDILDLRYQLLTVTAAALVAAERESGRRAVVLVHEFATSRTTDRKRAANARDLDRFVARVAGRAGWRGPLEPGTLAGPFRVPGEPVADGGISLYFGKAVADR